MKKQLTSQEWYQALIEECKAIITEAVHISRWALVEGYWNLGKRIREDKLAQEYAKGNKTFVQDLGQKIGVSTSTIYYALQAYDKYPDINTLPEGKNISWNKLITKYLPEKQETREDEIPIIKGKPKSKLGEIYQLGKHWLMCGDATKAENIKKLFNNDKAQAIITDPPYGVDFVKYKFIPENRKRQIDKRFDSIIGDDRRGKSQLEFIKNTFHFSKKHCIDTFPAYVFTSPLIEGLHSYMGLVEAGMHIQSQVIWVKKQFSLGQADYHWRHEICWYGWFGRGKHYWAGGRAETTVIDCQKPYGDDRVHPTQKPIELIARFINNSTPKNAIIFDPFGGSGTTLIACQQLDRICYMIEIDPHYCDVVRERYKNFTTKTAGEMTTKEIKKIFK